MYYLQVPRTSYEVHSDCKKPASCTWRYQIRSTALERNLVVDIFYALSSTFYLSLKVQHCTFLYEYEVQVHIYSTYKCEVPRTSSAFYLLRASTIYHPKKYKGVTSSTLPAHAQPAQLRDVSRMSLYYVPVTYLDM